MTQQSCLQALEAKPIVLQPLEQTLELDLVAFAGAQPGDAVPVLRVNPERPGRAEPRVRKRRPKQFDLLRRPRAELRQALFIQKDAA